MRYRDDDNHSVKVIGVPHYIIILYNYVTPNLCTYILIRRIKENKLIL